MTQPEFTKQLSDFLKEHPEIEICFSNPSIGPLVLSGLKIKMRYCNLYTGEQWSAYYVIDDGNYDPQMDFNEAIYLIIKILYKEIENKMNDSQAKFVRFDKWCKLCKHYEHKFPDEPFNSEAQEPCNTCLETGMRDGTEKPEYWEAK